MDYPSAKEYLFRLRHRGASYGIERMRRFAAELGNPQNQFPSIHVAGTNGKGSVCAIIESIYRAAGYRTGLYTSPHLVRQGERVQVNREILPEPAIAEYTDLLNPVAGKIAGEDPDLHPSFFEFMTAMALLHFAREKVDLGIFEVGLGGRLDATNILHPELSVITSIGLDHTEILGNSIEAIATEKAGILKAGTPVVIGSLPEAAERVVRDLAAGKNCPVFAITERFGNDPLGYPEPNLPGDYQRVNAAIALLAGEVLSERFPITAAAILQGLRQVDWPGRWQRLEVSGRNLVLDCTHNAEGAKVLDHNLTRLGEETGESPIIVTGTLGQPRTASILPVVARHAREIHLVKPRQPRACSFEEMEAHLSEFPVKKRHRSEVDDLFPFSGECQVGYPGDTVVVSGSIYLIGEICERLFHRAPVGQDSLQDI